MASIVDLVTELAAAVEGFAGAPTRLASDYRSDLEPIASGATLYQIQAALAGEASDSNVSRQVAAVTLNLLHKLTGPLLERTYTEGDMQAALADLTRRSWWRAFAAVYGIFGDGPSVEIERVGNVITVQCEIALALTP